MFPFLVYLSAEEVYMPAAKFSAYCSWRRAVRASARDGMTPHKR